MELTTAPTKDRVRENTSDKVNQEIDQKIEASTRYYAGLDKSSIEARVQELDREWDIERTLELNAAVVALSGVVLAATVDKKWLALPAVVTSFLIQHALQGWCPPLPLFRKLGVRTQKEIDTERFNLIKLLEE